MSSQNSTTGSDSFRPPGKYLGQDYRFTPTYLRPRDPITPATSPDIKPKEQQGHYPVTSLWTNTQNQNLWALVGIINNLGKWVLLSSGGVGPLISITGDDAVKVVPDVNGNINLQGFVVANGTHAKAIFTESPSVNLEKIDVQISAAIAATDITKVGLAAFLNSQFTVDVNGFVQLKGGTNPPITGIHPDAHTAPGTDPVIADASGNIRIEGGITFATGTQANPIRTNSLAANTLDLQIQLAGSNATVSTPNNFGVAQFDSTQFTVTNGYVQLNKIGQILTLNSQIFPTPGAFTYTPTAGMQYCIIECVGGGGGGGGSDATGVNQCAAGSSGGGGGYARKVVSAATIGVSQAVIVGARGAAGAAGVNPGGDGGTSSVGAIISATGGGGGGGHAASANAFPIATGTAGTGINGDLNLTASMGSYGLQIPSLNIVYSSNSGSSFFGGIIGSISIAGNGVSTTNFGVGGTGGVSPNSTGPFSGGQGGGGIVCITEFIIV